MKVEGLDSSGPDYMFIGVMVGRRCRSKIPPRSYEKREKTHTHEEI